MKTINRVGLVYGLLTVIGMKGKNSSGHLTWDCICECGNFTVATGNNLNSGTTKSCGCLKNKRAPNAVNLEGKKFGRLTVISVNSIENNICYWDCICICGNKTIASTGKLKSAHKKSCGCLASEVSRDFALMYLAGKKKISENGSLPKRVQKDGYVRVHDRDHKRSDRSGFVLEHIKVMEQSLNRSLVAGENVHHINGVRGDNRIENLELWDRSQPPGQRKWQKAKFYVEYLGSLNEEYLYSSAIEDLKKARWYVDREIARREKME